MNKRAYYARPISIDNTPQATRDIELINKLGWMPYPTGKEKEDILENYRIIGMVAFKSVVEESDLLIFRAFPDGSIGSGVAQEIEWAISKGIPVIEIPRQIERRTLTIDQTKEMLCELGQR